MEKAEVLQLTVEHLRSLKYGAEYSKGKTMINLSLTHKELKFKTNRKIETTKKSPCKSIKSYFSG